MNVYVKLGAKDLNLSVKVVDLEHCSSTTQPSFVLNFRAGVTESAKE